MAGVKQRIAGSVVEITANNDDNFPSLNTTLEHISAFAVLDDVGVEGSAVAGLLGNNAVLNRVHADSGAYPAGWVIFYTEEDSNNDVVAAAITEANPASRPGLTPPAQPTTVPLPVTTVPKRFDTLEEAIAWYEARTAL
jgi:hypothetical protein